MTQELEDYSIWYTAVEGIPYDGYFWEPVGTIVDKYWFRPSRITYVYQDVHDPEHRLFTNRPIFDNKKRI